MSNFGYEYILDCVQCDNSKIIDLDNIKEFVKDLIKNTDMNELGDIKYEYVDEEMAEKAGKPYITGYSICQFIITSSIVIHFCDGSNTLYFNLFSCKAFDKRTVKALLLKYFNGRVTNESYVTRG